MLVASAPPASDVGTVDVVPRQHQLGQELYLENCATCHVGVPPQVLPSETWLELIQDSQHYGVRLQPLVDPTRFLVWNYLKASSRQLLPEETTPYRVRDSRYFKVLHPKVELPRPLSLSSCVTCHPGATRYDFRSLTAEWKDAP